MTKEQIDELRQRWEKTTQGKWTVQLGYCGTRHQLFLVRPHCDGVSFGRHYDSTIQAQYDADAEFAAAAHESVPDLLDEVEALTARTRELEQENVRIWKLTGVLQGCVNTCAGTEEGQ